MCMSAPGLPPGPPCSRATQLWAKEDANACLMKMPTPWGKHHVLAALAPQINIGYEPYVRWWADIWCEVTGIVDPASILVVTDTNSAARPADRGTPCPDDTGYRTLLQAFNLRDLVDLHPAPQATSSCFQGIARSRIDRVTCHSEAIFTIPSYHYWGSTLLSDHHPLHRRPPGGPAGQTQPQCGLPHAGVPPGPSGSILADTADFQSSVLRRRLRRHKLPTL